MLNYVSISVSQIGQSASADPALLVPSYGHEDSGESLLTATDSLQPPESQGIDAPVLNPGNRSPTPLKGVADSVVLDGVPEVRASTTMVAAVASEPIEAPIAPLDVDAQAPGQTDVGVRQMPAHLQDQDPVFSANEMRLLHKNDCVGIISRLRNSPQEKSRLCIPLCRLITCPLVRPIIEQDVRKLENDFVRGYRVGDRVIYVSLYDAQDRETPVTGCEDVWENPIWTRENDKFEARLQADPDLRQFSGKFFHVYEGNHRVTAWTRHIQILHADDPNWYISPDCIVLDGRQQHGLLLNAMNDINWYSHYPHLYFIHASIL